MLKTKVELKEMLQDLEDHKRAIEFISYKSSEYGSGAGYFIPEHTKPYEKRQQRQKLSIVEFKHAVEFRIITGSPDHTLTYYTSVDYSNIGEIELIEAGSFNYYRIYHKDDTILEIFYTV